MLVNLSSSKETNAGVETTSSKYHYREGIEKGEAGNRVGERETADRSIKQQVECSNQAVIIFLRGFVSRGVRNDYATTQRFTLRSLRILRVRREKSNHERIKK